MADDDIFKCGSRSHAAEIAAARDSAAAAAAAEAIRCLETFLMKLKLAEYAWQTLLGFFWYVKKKDNAVVSSFEM